MQRDLRRLRRPRHSGPADWSTARQTVSIFGEDYPVLAKIYTIGGFSAHAGQTELLAWHRQTGQPAATFLVHGEEASMNTFAGLLSGTRVVMPERHRAYEV